MIVGDATSFKEEQGHLILSNTYLLCMRRGVGKGLVNAYISLPYRLAETLSTALQVREIYKIFRGHLVWKDV